MVSGWGNNTRGGRGRDEWGRGDVRDTQLPPTASVFPPPDRLPPCLLVSRLLASPITPMPLHPQQISRYDVVVSVFLRHPWRRSRRPRRPRVFVTPAHRCIPRLGPARWGIITDLSCRFGNPESSPYTRRKQASLVVKISATDRIHIYLWNDTLASDWRVCDQWACPRDVTGHWATRQAIDRKGCPLVGCRGKRWGKFVVCCEPWWVFVSALMFFFITFTFLLKVWYILL